MRPFVWEETRAAWRLDQNTCVDLVYQSREGFEGKVSELLAWIGRMRCMDGWPRGHKRKALDNITLALWHCCLGIASLDERRLRATRRGVLSAWIQAAVI